ncbi:hypothetical protein BJ138DRAFT_1147317 [Hygrophoropsis aurantiaca]|uniref:Uncharacterized protein n=1 Tax=Hygrophoropsis aurantiaca TaxID=72124 RepID=A0ACB8AI17_9AGAM|nr:hypothetical protein BJ138DRAFT_1147317 [Hygrophoropsis aurantiaca]
MDYSFPPPSFRPLLEEIASLLTSTSSTLCVAETTTGGLVSAALLSVPGASKWYVGGATLYSGVSRKALAGWTDENFKDYKGPTTELVATLATDIREKLGTTYCIGESGATGPTVRGGIYVHSVAGRTCMALASSNGGIATKVINTGKTVRQENMILFAQETLQFLRDVLAGDVKLEKNLDSGTAKF